MKSKCQIDSWAVAQEYGTTNVLRRDYLPQSVAGQGAFQAYGGPTLHAADPLRGARGRLMPPLDGGNCSIAQDRTRRLNFQLTLGAP